MPVKKYYSGHGEQVMEDMTKRYGKKKGKEVFYATANKRKHGAALDGLKKAGHK